MKFGIKSKIQDLFYGMVHKWNLAMESMFSIEISDCKTIPIIINNRNRLTYLLRLINSLTARGYYNIVIIDNNSSYPPLLEYYKYECPYRIFRLENNYGHLALWKSGVFRIFKNQFYVYTDPDLEIIEECPDNCLQLFYDELKTNKTLYKVGFSLKYDDLPDCYVHKNDVINWESSLYSKKYNNKFYYAHIDTTFALYRPRAKGGSHKFKVAIRSMYPYSIRHLPWYEDSHNLSQEDIYYKENAIMSTFWTKK
jgi:hypothetical protein